VQTRLARYSYRLPYRQAIRANSRHEDVAFLKTGHVHITVWADREDTRIADVFGELLYPKSSQHMELRKVRRQEFDRLENVPRYFEIGMMFRGAACGRGSLRYCEAAHRDQNDEDAQAHAALLAIALPRLLIGKSQCGSANDRTELA
jgi:hypothetical protein